MLLIPGSDPVVTDLLRSDVTGGEGGAVKRWKGCLEYGQCRYKIIERLDQRRGHALDIRDEGRQ